MGKSDIMLGHGLEQYLPNKVLPNINIEYETLI